MRKKPRIAPRTLLPLLALAAIALLLYSFTVGSADSMLHITLGDIFAVFRAPESNPTLSTILFQVRLPRLLLGLFVGGALAVSGTVMQSVFKNPMADPHILGVSSGASLGAAIAILFSPPKTTLGLSAIVCFAFLGGLVSVFLVQLIGARRSPVGMLLAGVAISALLTSATSMLMLLNRDKLEAVMLWTMGSLSSATWTKVAIVAPVTLLATILCCRFAPEMNALLLGEEEAAALGVPVTRTRHVLLTLSTLITATAVSVSGVIGFVGLMIPHALRMLLGPDHRILLPSALLGGALFLLGMDTLSRTIAHGMELPVGIFTALLGGPFFLWLLSRRTNL